MKISFLMIIFAAMLWGTTGTAQALAPTEASPLGVGALRLLIGGVALLIYIAFKKKHVISNIPKMPLFISALAMAAYQPFFFSGVHLTGVAIGTVVTICSAPMFSGVIEWMIYKKYPDRIWLFSTILAIIGCILLFQKGESAVVNPLGVVVALGAGLAFAVYTFVSKSLVSHHPPDVIVAIVFSTSAVLLLPFLFTTDLGWTLELTGALPVLHLGVLATGLAYILFARGLKGVEASTAVTLALVEPVTATLLGLLLLGENLTVLSGLGLTLLIMGLIILTTKDKIKSAQG